ncbi:peptidase S8/S53 domain-containing protein [Cladochytrium replicatum]|nr:peptidase S8/S53 domain-containing protein [Cladochytrium replicatum]
MAARSLSLIALALLAVIVFVDAAFIPNPHRRLRRRDDESSTYIVVYKDGADRAAHRAWLDKQFTSAAFEESQTEVLHSYNFSTWQAYAATVPEALAVKISKRKAIETVMEEIDYSVADVQQGATVGIARLSTQNAGGTTYTFPSSAGAGVDVYVIDTGIKTNHPEFEGRARLGRSFVNNGQGGDGNGHGTHVAGTVGSKTFGVAKKANLIAVRVLNAQGSGSSAGVLQGIEFSIAAAKASRRPSVINMSLGGQGDDPVTTRALNTANTNGVVVVVAAGNENQDACNTSPANVRSAVTVAAVNPRNDGMANFSNFGQCVDISAPGVNIQSTWIGTSNTPGNNGLTNIISGTSMASPHVAGVAALVYADNPTATANDIIQKLMAVALNNKVKNNKRQTPNKLAFNNGAAGFK